MRFLLVALFSLTGALSNSAFAVTAEECLDSAYEAIEAYFSQSGLAGERDIRCDKNSNFVYFYAGHYCEDDGRARMDVSIKSSKSDEDPLTCSLNYQFCDGSELNSTQPLDSNGDYGKAKGGVSKLCGGLSKPTNEFWYQEFPFTDANGTYLMRETYARRLRVKEYHCLFSEEYTSAYPDWTHSDAHFVWNDDAGFYTGIGDASGIGTDIINDRLCGAFYNPSDPIYNLVCNGPTLTKVKTWAEATSGDSGYCESFP